MDIIQCEAFKIYVVIPAISNALSFIATPLTISEWYSLNRKLNCGKKSMDRMNRTVFFKGFFFIYFRSSYSYDRSLDVCRIGHNKRSVHKLKTVCRYVTNVPKPTI